MSTDILTFKTPTALKRVDLKKILRMDFMIQHRCTGNAYEFARKMELSRSTLFAYLDYMRNDLGVVILYDKYRQTYHYDGPGLFAAMHLAPV